MRVGRGFERQGGFKTEVKFERRVRSRVHTRTLDIISTLFLAGDEYAPIEEKPSIWGQECVYECLALGRL